LLLPRRDSANPSKEATVTKFNRHRTFEHRPADTVAHSLPPMKTFAIFVLVLLSVGCSAPRASAQSCTTSQCTAASPSESDFLAALPSSSNKNATVVVTIPAGTASWTSGINYTVPPAVTNLTIQGATVVNCTGTAGSSSYACSAADKTVIEDSYPSNASLMTFSMSGVSSFFRFTGISLEGGAAGSGSTKDAVLDIYGPSHNIRLDHNHFDPETYSPSLSPSMVRIIGEAEGVLDHNLVDLAPCNYSSACSNFTTNGFQAFNNIGDSIGNGDGTWANPTAWGSSAFIFIENNVFNGGAPNDCANAGTFVMRYNTINDAYVGIQDHATKSPAGPTRGCRAYEAYFNYFTGPGGDSEADSAIGSKGGPSLVWGNKLASGAAYRLWAGNTDRQGGDEVETNTPNGWGYCGTAVNNNDVGSPWDGNSSTTTGYPCLDGIGRGQTTQSLNGQTFPKRLNASTSAITWPHQYLEPIYLWMNSIGNATAVNIRDSSTTQNIDLYSDQSNFDGTAGTGYGVLTSRPSTCTPGPGGTYHASPTGSYGVAYFATDANGGNGELFVCTSSNTWTPIYQPYTYPHPLTLGKTGSGSNPPNAPQNLTVTVQ